MASPPVGYLLDTDTLSNVLRGRSPVAVIRAMAQLPSEMLFTTAITVGELIYGAFSFSARKDVLLQAIDDLLTSIQVVPFDEPAARRYGSLRSDLERAGTSIGDGDTRIAAVALVHGLTVVTRNIRHFARVPGLAVVSWAD